jgi:hypothetical protein
MESEKAREYCSFEDGEREAPVAGKGWEVSWWRGTLKRVG